MRSPPRGGGTRRGPDDPVRAESETQTLADAGVFQKGPVRKTKPPGSGGLSRALTVLRSRLLERRVAEENAKYAAQRKAQVGTGERNERIRTYNFPQNRVTDHRIELTLYNLPFVMEGDIDPIIDPLINHDQEEKLAALSL
jgi:hypothetical protein